MSGDTGVYLYFDLLPIDIVRLLPIYFGSCYTKEERHLALTINLCIKHEGELYCFDCAEKWQRREHSRRVLANHKLCSWWLKKEYVRHERKPLF